MQKPQTLSDVLALFNSYHFVINESPLLTNADIGGRDEEEVYLSWVDEENGGEYFLPFENLEQADFRDGVLEVEDEDGTLCTVTFFDLKPLSDARDRYIILWTNEYDTGATYLFTVPTGTEVYTGQLEDYDPILEGEPCIEQTAAAFYDSILGMSR
jgi:hypothetical protein